MTLLYDYWRSSAAYRVRIALNMKGVAYDQKSVSLVAGGQQGSDYKGGINPQGLVPALEIDGHVLTQSMAIIECLDETIADPAFLPVGPIARARVRAMAQVIACDIHPVNNLRILKYLKNEMGQEQDAIDEWYRHWIREGLEALECQAKDLPEGAFLSGETPGLADICLVPQMYNARRFNLDLAPFPRLVAIDGACLGLPAFHEASPERQPDAA